MANTDNAPKFQDALEWLRNNQFDVRDNSGRVTVSKYGCVAELSAAESGQGKLVNYPSLVIAGEPAKLVDRGFQKFLKTSKLEVAATSDHLKALHRFSEELKEALGYTSLYNESLGSVSESYQYDRVKDRDLPESERPTRPWQR